MTSRPRPASTGSATGRPLSISSLASSSSSSSSATNARYSDRFIPSRVGSGDFRAAFSLLRKSYPACNAENASSVGNAGLRAGAGDAAYAATRRFNHAADDTAAAVTPVTSVTDNLSARQSYDMLLKSELLDVETCGAAGKNIVMAAAGGHTAIGSTKLGYRPGSHPSGADLCHNVPMSVRGSSNLFRFRASAPSGAAGFDDIGIRCGAGSFQYGSGGRGLGPGLGDPDLRRSALTAGMLDSAGTLASMSSHPRRPTRKISRTPFKVLDAPLLTDDFYLNLVDWSAENVLAVGLGSCVYLWSACTSLVTKLCDIGPEAKICSVSWSVRGKELAVGTSSGFVEVYDVASCAQIRRFAGHSARVGCLAWSTALLSSGSRDKHVLNRDIRSPEQLVSNLYGHDQEVCGLKWSPEETELASGGNDNQLLIWSTTRFGSLGNRRQSGATNSTSSSTFLAASEPLLRFTLHEAAVKAIAWSPHSRGLLASGGGTADRTIRFWNTVTNSALAGVDTGSQVCNLAWSKNVNEIVSTHGYSQNQIIVWRYPSLSKVVTLTGHTLRVLYLAVSPSGETIVTGCGDETLRFWNVFPSASNSQLSNSSSMLSPERMLIR